MSVVRRLSRAPFEVGRHFSWLMAAICLLPACGSSSGCGCDGFEARDFPSQHYDKTLPQGAQVHLTPTGAQFIEQNAATLIEQAVPGGLNFCLPKDTSSNPALCFEDRNGVQPLCDDGSEGCQVPLNLSAVKLRMVAAAGEPVIPDDTMVVEVTLSDINATIPFEYKGVPLIGDIKCDITLHKQGEPVTVPGSAKAKLPIRFVVNQAAPLKDVQIELGELDVDLSDLGIRPQGGGKCTLIEVIEPLVRPALEDRLLKPEINKLVQSLVNENLCRSCADDASSCPAGSTCEDRDGAQVCQYSNNQECVPALLGMEGRVQLGTLLAGFTQTPGANMDLSLRLADFARANDKGLTLAMRSGFQPGAYAQCVPVDPTPAGRPSFEKIPITNTLRANVKPGTSQPFMLGIGLHKRVIEHALWSVWGSGATCLAVDSSLSDLLATSTFGLFLPSLKTISDNEKRALFMQITPQRAPEVVLGTNNVSLSGDQYTVNDGLFSLDWKDLDIHVYGFVQDRYARLFTLRVDVLLPVALVPEEGALRLVPGELDGAIQNVRPINIALLSESAEAINGIVPQIVNLALPMLAGSLEQTIEVPELFGFQLDLQAGDITSIDEKQMIAIFANLKPAPATPAPLVAGTETVIHRVITRQPEALKPGEVGQPTLDVDVLGLVQGQEFSASGQRFEYSWRLNRGMWSQYTTATRLSISQPVLALPGEHVVEVRARQVGQPATTDPTPAMQKVVLDTLPPELSIERDGAIVTLKGQDIVDGPGDLQYRWRAHAHGTVTDWTDWSTKATVNLDAQGLPSPMRMEAEVRDRAGLIARDEQTIRYAAPTPKLGVVTTNRPAEGGSAFGCAAAGGSGRAPSGGGLGLLGMLGVGVFLRRRRRALTKIAALVGLLATASVTTGCGKDDVTPKNKACSPACEDGFTCEDGVCMPPPCDDGECNTSCGVGKAGMCDASGKCVCADLCADGCGEGTYCCFGEDACKPVPDPCAGKVCDPGFQPEVSAAGTPNSETCQLDGGRCDCVSMPPLPLGYHGRYLSVARGGGKAVIAAYNQTYGDLMVGALDASLEPTWTFVDGVPDGDIEGALDGPRGGVKDRGPKTGTHTAVAVDSAGVSHVFYRDEDAKTLRYARGDAASGMFELTTLDDQGDTGLYTQARFEGGKVHVVYLAQTVALDGGGFASQLRYLSFEPSVAVKDVNVASIAPEIVAQGDAVNPCGDTCERSEICVIATGQCAASTDDCGECGDGLTCVSGSCEQVYNSRGIIELTRAVGLYPDLSINAEGPLVVYYDHTQKTVAWSQRSADGAWSMPRQVGQPSGPYASGMRDAAGVLHLAYMDTSSYQLVYEQVDQGVREVIDNGLRDTASEWLLTRTGDDVTLLVGDDGKVRAIYHDATLQQLKVASRLGPNQWGTGKLTEPGAQWTGAHGYYAGLFRDSATPLAFEYVIQTREEPQYGYTSVLNLP